MIKRAYLYVNYRNIIVLKTYLDVIKSALEGIGYDCYYSKDLSRVGKRDLVVFPMGIDAFRFFIKGYHNFILWQQGVTADESYMRNHSRLRYWMLNAIDLFAMKNARVILYVSDYMRQHYEKIGHCSFSEYSYVMPCFNESFDKRVFVQKDYSKKTFSYVGSLDLWQCFDRIVDLYKKIEEKLPNSFLKVLTFDVESGRKVLLEKGVKHFSIMRVPKEQVKNELLSVNYGFIIREDCIVNRVATPTKISSYLSSGVIPIFSRCLSDFARRSLHMKYALPVDDAVDESELLSFINQDVLIDEISAEYERVFSDYYSPNYHIEKLMMLFKTLGLSE